MDIKRLIVRMFGSFHRGGVIAALFKGYPLRTIWFNFKVLPFRQAIRLPFFIYSKTIFRNLSGRITIDSDRISTNMIKIGADWWYPATSKPLVIWSIYGTLVFKGPISFPQGTYIHVAKNGVLQFGSKETMIGTNTKIMCFEKITIGDSARITWDCQIYDTSFHYIEVEGIAMKLTSPIYIGNNVWVGNNTTITKGVFIPDWSIITSHSLVNKDLSSYGEHCMFAGCPVMLKKRGVTRVFDIEKEKSLDQQYNYSRNNL